MGRWHDVGAVAVAVAASHAAAATLAGTRHLPRRRHTARTAGAGTSRLRPARRILGAAIAEAAYELGNGEQVTAQDTVPFTIWVAARFLADYPTAIRACIQTGSDTDTTT